jgi:hypothetical protein
VHNFVACCAVALRILATIICKIRSLLFVILTFTLDRDHGKAESFITPGYYQDWERSGGGRTQRLSTSRPGEPWKHLFYELGFARGACRWRCTVGHVSNVETQLIATRYLKNLFQFSPLPPSIQQAAQIPLASQRSPLLTNGHNLGGPYELDWEKGMPIGDVFVTIMKRSWALQRRQQRENISPR